MRGMRTPSIYQKRPVMVEAMQLAGTAADVFDVCAWLVRSGYPWLIGNALEPDTLRLREHPNTDVRPTRGIYIDPADGALMIRTLEGDMKARNGDWVIRGVQGEFYPCKDSIFHATYDGPVEECGATALAESALAAARNFDADRKATRNG